MQALAGREGCSGSGSRRTGDAPQQQQHPASPTLWDRPQGGGQEEKKAWMEGASATSTHQVTYPPHTLTHTCTQSCCSQSLQRISQSSPCKGCLQAAAPTSVPSLHHHPPVHHRRGEVGWGGHHACATCSGVCVCFGSSPMYRVV